MNVKIRNKFIEIKYSVSNGLVIFITNYWWFRILEIIPSPNHSPLERPPIYILVLPTVAQFSHTVYQVLHVSP